MQALAVVQVTEGTFKLKGQSKNHMIYISLAMLLIHGASAAQQQSSINDADQSVAELEKRIDSGDLKAILDLGRLGRSAPSVLAYLRSVRSRDPDRDSPLNT